MVFHNFREPFSVIALPFKVARPLFCNNNSCMGRGPQRQRLQWQKLQRQKLPQQQANPPHSRLMPLPSL